MSFTIGENYLLKALDAYPWNMEVVAENLNYALSYDDENDVAWTLHGKVMIHHLRDHLGAEESFIQALELNGLNHDAMFELIWLYIEQARFMEATARIIEAKKIRGADLAVLYRTEAVIHERKQNLAKAKAALKEAQLFSYNKEFDAFLKNELKRIKNKIKQLEKKQRKLNEKEEIPEPKKKNFSLLRLFF